ncbi:MAG: DUF4445 domain-containing protein [Desulfobacterales bacterium]|nr:DUF4445 domain-containing protein [Desulfobacterales bacterium]
MVDSTGKPEVVFLPGGMRSRVQPGISLDQAARDSGADLQCVCGGRGKCGKCRVRAVPAHASKTALSLPTEEELRALSPEAIAAGWRLACQARVQADVTIDIPEESRTGIQVIAKAPGSQRVFPDPAVTRLSLKVPPADLENPVADWERLGVGLGRNEKTIVFDPDLALLRNLPEALRQNGGEVCVILDNSGRCTGIFEDAAMPLTGIALDIGTTSLAAALCNLETGEVMATASAINPQVTCGEDVISRIAYAGQSGEKRAQLQDAVIGGINRLIDQLAEESGISPSAMADMVCVGNTCMHHLLLGIDPTGLGRAPFVPAVSRPLDLCARDLGIAMAPGASVHMLPVVAGFVGADTVGALLATHPEPGNETVLLVDVGTNGEIVLACGDRLVCTSCATGPALEGATLCHGMRAAVGAVERVWIDPDSLEVRYRVIGDSPDRSVPAAGICGSGVIDAAAQMFSAGIINPSGRIDRSLDTPRIIDQGGETAFVLVPDKESATGRNIVINQEDIRAIQMAKGAIQAAVTLLMAETGVHAVDRVLLAGAFGSVIDPVSAVIIGLFPDLGGANISAVGNAAGDGARLALLNRGKRRDASRLARKMAFLELTTHPRFQRTFAMSMHFPRMAKRIGRSS